MAVAAAKKVDNCQLEKRSIRNMRVLVMLPKSHLNIISILCIGEEEERLPHFPTRSN